VVHGYVGKSDITVTNSSTKRTNFNVLFTEVNMHMYVYIHPCTSYIDDFITVPYTGDDTVACRLFCTTALPDDGPVRAGTRSFVKLRHSSVCILLVQSVKII
jgi:hypothetical protein